MGVTLIVIGGQEAVGGLNVTGDVGALATAVSWAAYSVLIRPLMRRVVIGRRQGGPPVIAEPGI